MPRLRSYQLCARYRVKPGEIVGGDWYDVEHLGDGYLGFSLGDVVGHGVSAAAATRDVRRAVRNLARLDPTPLSVLERLNRATLDIPGAFCSTIVYGVLDPDGNGELVRAGHPPPVLWRDGYLPDLLLTAGNPPLGTHLDYTLENWRFELPVGGRLLLFSDGLVERRKPDIDEDLARLIDTIVAFAPTLDLEQFCDALIAQLVSNDHEDDVALLCIERVEKGAKARLGAPASCGTQPSDAGYDERLEATASVTRAPTEHLDPRKEPATTTPGS